jgi:hypothetical protein
VTINKFNPNLVLVNINKLKPYRFMEDHILQPILVKLIDLLLKKPSETNHFGNMFINFKINLNQPICSLKNKFK